MRSAILHLKKADPVLATIIERVGRFRMSYEEPAFQGLAEAIVYQQLHGKAAATIFKRLTDLAGMPLTPEGILKLTPEEMRAVSITADGGGMGTLVGFLASALGLAEGARKDRAAANGAAK